MKFDHYGKLPEKRDKTIGKIIEGKYPRKIEDDGEDDRNWAPSAEEVLAGDWEKNLQERLMAFRHDIDSILTLQIHGKLEEERIRMLKDALERQRIWAMGIDRRCKGETPAMDYLEEKIRSLGKGGAS